MKNFGHNFVKLSPLFLFFLLLYIFYLHHKLQYVKQLEDLLMQCQADRLSLCTYIDNLPKKYRFVSEECLRDISIRR